MGIFNNKYKIDYHNNFELKITPLFYHMFAFIWLFFIIFWVLLILGVGTSVHMVIKEGEPIYFIPFFSLFWFLLLWSFFYIWGWYILASNYPTKVIKNGSQLDFKYSIPFLNKSFKAGEFQLSDRKFLGNNFIKIKIRNRFLAYRLPKSSFTVYYPDRKLE